jgi:hypothetical protein
MLPLKSSVCLHAQLPDLKFLNPVRNRISKLLGSRLKVHTLSTQASHAEAMLALSHAVDGFIVIFAHGSGDYLRGGGYRSRTSGENVEVEKFLTRDDLRLFQGKVVFCMSCDSNELAQASLNAGAVAFVGFDQIPFNRFDAHGEAIGSHVLVKHCQELIAEAIQVTLERFVTGRGSLDECVDFLRLWVSQKAIDYVRGMAIKGVKERKEVAALLLKIQTGVKYHGQRGIYFESNG